MCAAVWSGHRTDKGAHLVPFHTSGGVCVCVLSVLWVNPVVILQGCVMVRLDSAVTTILLI